MESRESFSARYTGLQSNRETANSEIEPHGEDTKAYHRKWNVRGSDSNVVDHGNFKKNQSKTDFSAAVMKLWYLITGVGILIFVTLIMRHSFVFRDKGGDHGMQTQADEFNRSDRVIESHHAESTAAENESATKLSTFFEMELPNPDNASVADFNYDGNAVDQENDNEASDIHYFGESRLYSESEYMISDSDSEDVDSYDFSDETDEENKPDVESPFYLDDWEGDCADSLLLSKKSSKVPLYRLPFIEGQNHETNNIGLHTFDVDVPTEMSFVGISPLADSVNGKYKLMMTEETYPKPMLWHGRLIWSQETPVHGKEPYHIFYDHLYHNWVLSNKLEMEYPEPEAFLPHGAMIPVPRKKRDPVRQYGVPNSVKWLIRKSGGEGLQKANEWNLEVSNDAPKVTVHFNKVYLIPNKNLEEEEEEEQANIRNEDNKFDQDVKEIPSKIQKKYSREVVYKSALERLLGDDIHSLSVPEKHEFSRILGISPDEENPGDMERLSKTGHEVPRGLKTYQEYVTHPTTLVYHTFDDFHDKFDHDRIVDNPVLYIQNNHHADVVGFEKEFFENEKRHHPHRHRKKY